MAYVEATAGWAWGYEIMCVGVVHNTLFDDTDPKAYGPMWWWIVDVRWEWDPDAAAWLLTIEKHYLRD